MIYVGLINVVVYKLLFPTCIIIAICLSKTNDKINNNKMHNYDIMIAAVEYIARFNCSAIAPKIAILQTHPQKIVAFQERSRRVTQSFCIHEVQVEQSINQL